MTVPRDPESLRVQLVDWIRGQVEGAAQNGVVVGLSGGIDSAVVCGLAAQAVGPERCLGVLLPIESIPDDLRLANAVADRFGVEALVVELEPAFQALLTALTRSRERAQRVAGLADPSRVTAPIVTNDAGALARVNLKPRLRMASLYYFANLLGYIVLGTGNKDEFTVGYFTKWGDGAADAFPLADLVKAEVRAVARLIGVPAQIVDRPPSAGLWLGQTDEDELGVTYEQLDRYILTGTSGDAAADAEIRRRQTLSRHKSAPAPVAQPT
jgi:NAD+ synthase